MKMKEQNNPFYKDLYYPENSWQRNLSEYNRMFIERQANIRNDNNELYSLQLKRINFVESLFSKDSIGEIIEKIKYVADKDLLLHYIEVMNFGSIHREKFNEMCYYLATDKYICNDEIRKDSLEYFTSELLNEYYYYQEVFSFLENEQEVLTVLLKLDYSSLISDAFYTHYFDENFNISEKVEANYWKSFNRHWSVKLVDQEYVIERMFLHENYTMVIKVITYNFIVTGIISIQSYEYLLVSLYLIDPEFNGEYARLGKMQRKVYENITIDKKRVIEEFILTHLMNYRFRMKLYSLGTTYCKNPDLFINLYVESKTNVKKKLILDYITSYPNYNKATVNDILFIYQHGTEFHNENYFNRIIGKIFYITIKENCTKTNEEGLILLNDNKEILNGFTGSMLRTRVLQYDEEEIQHGIAVHVESDLKDQINKLTVFIDLCNIAGFINISSECSRTLIELKKLSKEIELKEKIRNGRFSDCEFESPNDF